MDYHQIAGDILRYVGGKENVDQVTHCFTRLRFLLNEESLADKAKLEQLEGVITVVSSGGEYQVVCGAKVDKIYSALTEILGEDRSTKPAEKKPVGQMILQTITQIFTPLVPAIAAAGLIKGLLTAAKLLMLQRGVDISTTDTYMILYSASQVIFYFFPIFLAMTTAKALKCNQVIAMVIAGTLVYPAIDTMIQDAATKTTIFGLPVIKGAWKIGESVKVFSYTESVIPILLAIIVMAYLEKGLKKWIPEVVQLILIPGLELIIMIPITLSILGPIGIYIGNAIQIAYDLVISISPLLGGMLIGGLWGVFVIFGAHRALIPIGLNDVALNGRQNILAFAGAANFAQGGAALGVMLKTKSKELKQIAASGSIAATLVGVTEPAIYGCNLRLKKPMICAVIAGTVGGGIMGFGGVYGDAFANNGVLTIFTYAAFGMIKFCFYLVGVAVAFFGAAVLTYLVGFEDVVKEEVKNETNVEITSPISGIAVPLQEVKDEVFAGEHLGKGVAVIPDKGMVTAPADGTIMVMYPTLHAVGMRLDSGVELLIHVGINTVELNGKYFEQFANEGDRVQKGDNILAFDIEAIIQEGYDVTTPIIIANTPEYSQITSEKGEVDTDSILIKLSK